MRTPDLRFHIASLAAVFLALGIGILIGTAFVGAPVVQRQTGLIRRLEGNVSELRKETREREQSEEALRALLPRVVHRSLAGRRVLVVQAGPYADAADAAASALTAAGATVTRVVLPVEAWRHRLNDPASTPDALADEAHRLAPALLSATTAGEGDAPASYRADGLVAGEEPNATPSPEEPPILAPPSGAAKLVVLVGGAPASGGQNGATPGAEASALLTIAQTRDAALIATWQESGATVVGVEPSHADVSFMRVYQSAGAAATIDNIDRAVVQITLPFALLGERGNYGQKSTADRTALPPSLSVFTPAEPTLSAPTAMSVASPRPSASPKPSVSPSATAP